MKELLTNHLDTAHRYLRKLKKAIKRTDSKLMMNDRENLKSFMFDKANNWVFEDVYCSEDFLQYDELEAEQTEGSTYEQ